MEFTNKECAVGPRQAPRAVRHDGPGGDRHRRDAWRRAGGGRGVRGGGWLAGGRGGAGGGGVAASRKADACAEAEAHLRGMGGEALGIPTHLGDLTALRTLVARTLDAFGAIDVVVNNAANALAL